MAITHTNREGKTYYLHVGRTRAGKPNYYFSQKSGGTLAEAIPEGYEVYEKPQGQVFLRKAVARLITPEEVALVEEGVRKHAGLNVFIVEVEKDSIVVHLPNQSAADMDRMITELSGFRRPHLVEKMQWQGSFSPEMRFVLRDKEARVFEVQRWCYRGAIDGWTYGLASGPLAVMVARYAVHLGKESFFDLM
jgi:hypothetical protein